MTSRRQIAVRADPVIGYAMPVAVSKQPGKRAARRAGAFHGFKIRLLDFYRDEICAAAECAGGSPQDFCYQALLEAARDVAAQFGMTPDSLAKLSQPARAELATKRRAVNLAVKYARPALKN